MCATTKKESKYNNFLAITLVHDRPGSFGFILQELMISNETYVKCNVCRFFFLDWVKKSKQ